MQVFRPLLTPDTDTDAVGDAGALPAPARQVIVAFVQPGETPAQALRGIAQSLESEA